MLRRLLFFIFTIFILLGCNSEMNKELVSAAGTGNILRVESLIKQGANVEAHAIDGWTPLTAAASAGHFEIVRLLLMAKVDINAPENGGNTALFWAAFHGHAEVVRLLLEHGADALKKGKNGRLPIDVARERKYEQIVILLQ
ncbi:MAG: ankyrin repeat domain-containing protein [Desulfocapsaceae bacterium]|nr:ankyrin repeat domain-containing protein [Desulfocapsaceae bacterium]